MLKYCYLYNIKCSDINQVPCFMLYLISSAVTLLDIQLNTGIQGTLYGQKHWATYTLYLQELLSHGNAYHEAPYPPPPGAFVLMLMREEVWNAERLRLLHTTHIRPRSVTLHGLPLCGRVAVVPKCFRSVTVKYLGRKNVHEPS